MPALGGAEAVAAGPAQALQLGVEGGPAHRQLPAEADQAYQVRRPARPVEAVERLLEKPGEVLRRGGRFSLSAAEGRHGISDEEREAAIPEDGSLLLFVSRRGPGR